jgi:hypothetical protein
MREEVEGASPLLQTQFFQSRDREGAAPSNRFLTGAALTFFIARRGTGDAHGG